MDFIELAGANSLFDPLHTRQDKDMTLYYLKKFKLCTPAGVPIPDAKSITLNDARTFADRYMSIMNSAKENIQVTVKDRELEAYLEGFYQTVIDRHDLSPISFLSGTLSSYLNFQFGLRGWGAVLVVVNKMGDRYSVDLLTLDTRWMKWKIGRKGFTWVSYRTQLSRDEIKQLYGQDAPGNGEYIDVEIVWDNEYQRVFIPPGKLSRDRKYKQIWAKKHGLPRIPIIIVPVPTQPMIISATTDWGQSLSTVGESIYAANRTLYPELHELASVIASINLQSFMTPVAYVGNREAPGRLFGVGVKVSLIPGEEIVKLPTIEMNTAVNALFAQLISREQKGALTSTDYGDLPFQLSALAIAKLSESRDQVFVPRLKAKEQLYRKVFYMIKEQIALGKCYDTQVDEEEAIEIEVESFKKDFTVGMNFYTVSPEENVANLTTASTALAVGRAKLMVFRDVLKSQNPKEELMMAEADNADKEIPELRLYKYAVAKAPGKLPDDDFNEAQAKLIQWKLMTNMKQNNPELPPPDLKLPSRQASPMPETTETKINKASQTRKAQAANIAGQKSNEV